jgi:hypothetical protein
MALQKNPPWDLVRGCRLGPRQVVIEETHMDKKIVGLVGAISGLASLSAAQGDPDNAAERDGDFRSEVICRTARTYTKCSPPLAGRRRGSRSRRSLGLG